MAVNPPARTFDGPADVFAALIAQGGPGVVAGHCNWCCYFGDQGRGCAVGIMLPPELRDRAIDEDWNGGAGVEDPPPDVRALLPDWARENGDYLAGVMQNAHDEAVGSLKGWDEDDEEGWPKALASWWLAHGLPFHDGWKP